ncbi:MAG: PAS domain S-box protein [Gemmatimonadales bacterium]
MPGLRVILVEDRASDAELVARELRRAGIECEIYRVQTEPELTDALRTFGPDLVLSDHSLPAFSARDTLRIVQEMSPHLPVIIVTGSLDEETAAEYIRTGAADYIVKDRLHRLGPAITRAMELKAAREEQVLAEARFRALVENSSDAVIIAGPDQLVRYASPAISGILGLSPAEYVGRRAFALVHPDDAAQALSLFREMVTRPGATVHREVRVRHADGRWRLVDIIGANRLNNPAIQGMVAHLRDITEQRQAEHERREADRRYRELAESAPLGVCQSTVEGRFIMLNHELARMLGYDDREELAQIRVTDLYADPAGRDRAVTRLLSENYRLDTIVTWKKKDGKPIRVQLNARAVTDSEGKIRHFESFVTDVTERERLEAQFRQAQKMEAVGRLAGGVAHDFNNILTAILGGSDLALAELAADAPAALELVEIRRSAERAAALTRQLLTFSRQQVLTPRVLDLNALIGNTVAMVRRLIGEDVRLEVTQAEGIWAVRADPGELEQILMNLVVNARDAMPRGGQLTIETRNVELDGVYDAEQTAVQAGDYVLLAMTDTGTGMTEEVKARLFEPFFTTKELGLGTGLGLATVYGIVKQAGGHIWVYSELDHGTTFKVYLPRVTEAVTVEHVARHTPVPTGDETILLVEDEEAVRRITRRILIERGYTVLEASSGDEAVRLAGAHPGPIHLLATDVVMPGISGRELAGRLQAARPKLTVLYLSGYADDAVVRHGILEATVNFLQKPFTMDGLSRKVRQTLDAKGGA